jgi:hypothetical protein
VVALVATELVVGLDVPASSPALPFFARSNRPMLLLPVGVDRELLGTAATAVVPCGSGAGLLVCDLCVEVDAVLAHLRLKNCIQDAGMLLQEPPELLRGAAA